MGELSIWHWLIVLAVVILLFGSTRLPGAARSLGRSMRIFKSETHGLMTDDDEPGVPARETHEGPAPAREVPAGPEASGQGVPTGPEATARELREEAARLRDEAARLDDQADPPQDRTVPGRDAAPGGDRSPGRG
ncbi:Sec-independent protein translocase subunit TatA [Actinoallomurus rhizosphaericola]|uniref:Sec-independent protein translocase subunit TatA n=1 Tax=Actinoallomurus rhizosphaericola TaxID=2952536 RepID=UPI002093A681|nr:Sec-independent protein translocase subunit TatA [Actinoallomurus rhizosphaericola]MCO5995490.1 Sec-independent protein translocase subunit TatA [Actinoallomurus rhizosphaericola]